MKKFMQKMISSLLCVAMVISLLPISVFATEEVYVGEEIPVELTDVQESLDVVVEESEEDTPVVLESDVREALGADEVITSGDCGVSATWSFEDGILTISGTGAMRNYSTGEHPWEHLRRDIINVIVEEGITELCIYAFGHCPNLLDVSLPESLEVVGDYAFYNCDAMQTIVFSWSNNLTTIGMGSFADCDMLQVVQVPYGVTTIGAAAFAECPMLFDVKLPRTITSIEEDSFILCDNLTITFDGTIAQWEAAGGYFDAICSDGTYTVPAGGVGGGNNGGNGGGVTPGNTTWTFDDGVLTISGTGAMEQYNSGGIPWESLRGDITEVVVEEGITHLSIFAFAYCYNLVDVSLPSTLVAISDYAFFDCEALETITLPAGITSIGMSSFGECDAMVTATVPSGVTYLGNSAYSGCDNLETIYIPVSVTTIEDSAFINSYKLFVNYGGTMQQWVDLGMGGLRAICSDGTYNPNEGEGGPDEPADPISGQCGPDLSWSYYDGELNITGTGDMYDYASAADVPWNDVRPEILTVNIADGVTSIGSYAFAGCTYLLTVEVPDSVDYIGAYAFHDCDHVAAFALNGDMSVVNPYTFAECDGLQSVTLPYGVTEIGEGAFENCPSLTRVYVPKSVQEIHETAFNGCDNLIVAYGGNIEDWIELGFGHIHALCNNGEYIPGEGGDDDDNGGGEGGGNGTPELPEGNIVDWGYFYENTDVYWALDDNGVLTIAADGTGNGWMDHWVQLWNFEEVRVVNVEEGVTVISSGAFSDHWNLEEVNLPDSLEEIGMNAFGGCASLESIAIPKNVSLIDTYAFNECPALQEITVSAENEHYFSEEGVLYRTAGEDEGALTYLVRFPAGRTGEFVVPDFVDAIDSLAFCGSALTKVTLPQHWMAIQYNAFQDTQIETLIAHKEFGYVALSCFMGSDQLTVYGYTGSKLEYVAEAQGVPFVAIGALEDEVQTEYELESGIKVTVSKLGVMTISGNGVLDAEEFDYAGIASSALEIVIEEGITAIGDDVFFNVDMFKVTLPEGLKSIGQSAFASCMNLTSIVFPESLETIGKFAFRDVYLNSVYIPENVQLIGAGAFAGGDTFTVAADSEWYSAKDGVLYSKNGATLVAFPANGTMEFDIPANVTAIGAHAFEMSELDRIIIPETVKYIGEYAFANVGYLEIELPNGLEYINKGMFENTELSIVIPNTVTEIYSSAFNVWGFGDFIFLGTEEEWNAIDVACEYEGDNFMLQDAPITFMPMPTFPVEGMVGENISWQLTADGTLTISGNGVMEDFVVYDPEDDSQTIVDAPWTQYARYIKKLQVTEGIVELGTGAFRGLYNLQEAVLADSVAIMGGATFNGCRSLKKVNIPKSLEWVSGEWFDGCTALETIVVPNDHECFKVVDGVLFSKDMSSLRLYPAGLEATKYTVPNGVVEIGEQAFICASLEELTIADTVRTMCDGWAINAVNLKKVTIPGSVMNFHCGWRWHPEEMVIYGYTNSAAERYAEAFGIPFESLGVMEAEVIEEGTCENITWTLDNMGALTISGTGAMPDVGGYSNYPWSDYVDLIRTVVIEEGITEISDSAFMYCGIEAVELPTTLEKIGDRAFYLCYFMDMPELPEGLQSIGDYAFYGSNTEEGQIPVIVNIPSTLREIGVGAFVNANIEGFSVADGGQFSTHEGVLYSPDMKTLLAYPDAKYMEEYEIPEGVTAIADYAFNAINGIGTVVLPDTMKTIGDFAFHSAGLSEINFPEGLQSIGELAFGYSEIEEFYIPASLTNLGPGALSSTKSKSYTVASGNTAYTTVDGVLFTKDMKTLLAYPVQKEGAEYTVPAGVTHLGTDAFAFCELQKVTLPEGLLSIGDYAFESAHSLETVVIPDSVKSIGEAVFLEAISLMDVTLPADLQELGYAAFAYSGIVAVAIPDGVKILPESLFEGCFNLASVIISRGVSEIHGYAFAYCDKLVDVYYEGSPMRWSGILISETNDEWLAQAELHFAEEDTGPVEGKCGTNAKWKLENGILTISGTGAMTNYDFEEGVYAPWYVYNGSVREVVVKKGITSIGNSAFYMCADMNSVTLPSGLKTIGDDAFYGCGALEEIQIPSTVTKIGGRAFAAAGLMWVEVPGSVVTLGELAFAACENLESVVLMSGTKTIGAFAFVEDWNLEEIVIPTSVTKIAEGAFYGCNGLTHVYYLGTATQWKNIAIGYECEDLENAILHLKAASYNDHDFTMTVVAPTCAESGYDKYTCTCGAVYKDNYVDALPHQPVADAAVAPTCTKTGLTEGEHCEGCGFVFVEQEVVPALGHAWMNEELTAEATSSASAKMRFVCEECGAKETRSLKISKPTIVELFNDKQGVILMWPEVNETEDESNFVAGYRVYRKLSGATKWSVVCEATEATVFVDTEVVSGKKYVYTVSCLSGDDKQISSYSTTGKSILYLAQPEITSISNEEKGIKITWDKVAGASKYRVYLLDEEHNAIKVADTSATSYVYTQAENGKGYRFTVSAMDSTKPVSSHNPNGAYIEYVSTPTVSLTNNSECVDISWAAVDHPDVAGYWIYRKAGSGDWTYVDQTNKLKYSDYDVESGKKYTYAVVCVDAAGNALNGSEFKGVTLTFVERPMLTSLVNQQGSIKLTWTPVAGAYKYRVFMVVGDGDTLTKLADTSKTTYTFTKPKHGVMYWYYIAALDKAGNIISKQPNLFDVVQCHYIEVPTIESVTNDGNTVVFRWKELPAENSGYSEGFKFAYNVYRKAGSGDWERMTDYRIYDLYYVDTNVESGVKYTYTVCAADGLDNQLSAYNSTGKSITFVAQPEFSKIENVSTGIKLDWNKVAGASKYRIYLVSEDGILSKITDTSSLTYTYTKAKNDLEYTFTIAALNKDGKVVSTYNEAGTTYEFVSAPVISAVKSVAEGTEISWNAVANDSVNGYEVLRQDGSNWVVVGVCAADELSCVDTTVTSGTSYTYAVRALGTPNSGQSASKKLTFVAQPEISNIENVSGGIKLAWNKVAGASKYRVYLMNADGTMTKLTDTSSLTYTYTKAKNDVEYTFTIAALNKDGKVVSSYNEAGTTYEFVSAPTVSAVKSVADGVEISWNAVANDSVNGYEVLRQDGSVWVVVGVCAADELSCVDATVTSGTSYTYAVRALGTPCSGQSASKKLTFVAQPEISSIENVSNGIKLDWNKVTGASKYRVYLMNADGTKTKLTDTSKLTYTYTKAKNDVEYTFTIAALNKDGVVVSSYNEAGTTYEFVSAPVISSLKNVADGVEISWNAVVNDSVAGYEVLRKSGDVWVPIYECGSDELSYVDDSTALVGGVKYTYTVRAVGTPDSGITTGKSITRVEQPDFTDFFNVETGVALYWNKVVGASKYRIYLVNADGSVTKVTDTSKLTYTYTKVKHDTEYTFTIAALDKDGKVVSSYMEDGVSVTYLTPPAVKSVTAVAEGVEITWNPVTVTLEGNVLYGVYRKAPGDADWQWLEDVAGLSYVDTTVESGVKYTYSLDVYVIGSGDEESYMTACSGISSKSKSITYYAQPWMEAVNEDGGIRLNWEKVNGVYKYRIFLKTADGSLKKLTDTTKDTYLYTKAAYGEECTFVIRCLNKAGSYIGSYDADGLTITRTIELVVAVPVSDATAQGMALQEMSQMLYDSTEGRYKLKLEVNDMYTGDAENLQSITDGALDMALVDSAALEDYEQAFAMLSAPFVFEDTAHLSNALGCGALDELYVSTKDFGFEVVGGFAVSPTGIFTTNGPVIDLEDMEGKIIRIAYRDGVIGAMEALGANPMLMAMSEVPDALQQGVLDGCEGTIDTYMGMSMMNSLNEIAPYFTYTNHWMAPQLLVVSNELLESMSDEDVQALRDAQYYATGVCNETLNDWHYGTVEALESMGVQFEGCDRYAFEQACEEVILGMAGDSQLALDVYEAIKNAIVAE